MKELKSDGPSLNKQWPTRALFFTFLITHVPWWLWQLQITASSQADVQGSSRLSSQEPWASCPKSCFRTYSPVARRVPSPSSSAMGSVPCLHELSHSSKIKALGQHQFLSMFRPNSWASPWSPVGLFGAANVILSVVSASAEERHDHIYCCCYSGARMTFFSPCGWALPVHLSPLPPSLQG